MRGKRARGGEGMVVHLMYRAAAKDMLLRVLWVAWSVQAFVLLMSDIYAMSVFCAEYAHCAQDHQLQ